MQINNLLEEIVPERNKKIIHQYLKEREIGKIKEKKTL
jgi:hypothetical protein